MPDLEKVIRGLTACADNTPTEDCRKCPYQGEEYCTDAVMLDALALLRKQEPVKPITQDAWPNPVKVCGNCKGYITYTAGRPRFCPNCGWEMKWDEQTGEA